MSLRLIQFGSVYLPIWNAASGLAFEARQGIQEMRGGGYDSDGQRVYPKPAPITLAAEVVDTDDEDIDDQLDAMFAEFARGRLPVVGENRKGVRRYTRIKLASGQRNWATGQVAHQPLALTFTQIYPYWMAWDDAPPIADMGNVADGGLVADGQYEETTLTDTSTTFSITNSGGVPVEQGKSRIEVQSSSEIVNPGVVNDTLGLAFRYAGTLSEGDILMIDWLARACRLNGENAYANLSVSDRHNWMQLKRGTNDFTFHGDSVTGTIKLYTLWQRHYL